MGLSYEIYKAGSRDVQHLIDYLIITLPNLRQTDELSILGILGEFYTISFNVFDKTDFDDIDFSELIFEDFAFRYTIEFSIYPYNKDDTDNSLVELYQAVLDYDTEDSAMSFNGEMPVMIRQKGKVKINLLYDDQGLFPFKRLKSKYVEAKIPLMGMSEKSDGDLT